MLTGHCQQRLAPALLHLPWELPPRPAPPRSLQLRLQLLPQLLLQELAGGRAPLAVLCWSAALPRRRTQAVLAARRLQQTSPALMHPQ